MDSFRKGELDFVVPLSDAAECNPLRPESGSKGQSKLSDRPDVRPKAFGRNRMEKCGIAVRFYCITGKMRRSIECRFDPAAAVENRRKGIAVGRRPILLCHG